MRYYYRLTIIPTPGQAVFGIEILFSLVSVVDWKVLTSMKQQQLDIDNVKENSRQVTHDYEIVNIFYV